MKIFYSVVTIVSAAFAVSRFFAPHRDLSFWGSWEAFAHLYIGFLIGCCMFLWKSGRGRFWLFVALISVPSVVETVCFFLKIN